MPKQAEQSKDRYFDIFPKILRSLLESHPTDGHTTTYKALGEAVGVRQQTISQYASGQTQPTADVALRIARFFGVSVDYLLTGVSSQNQDICEELGLSETAVEFLRRAADMYSPKNTDRKETMPYLNELLSDKEFYEFLDELHDYANTLQNTLTMSKEKKAQFEGLDLAGYFIWDLQKFVEDFILKELQKLGLGIDQR